MQVKQLVIVLEDGPTAVIAAAVPPNAFQVPSTYAHDLGFSYFST
jgi:hypothetical protein